jgi:hypothetical protein
MSADPYIQAPDELQSYNRYSYVMNNPLNATDPSGYLSLKKFLRNPHQTLMHLGDRISSIGVSLGTSYLYHKSVNFLSGSGGYQLKSVAISVGSAYCGAWVAACNGAGQLGLAKGYGASDADAFKTGAIAAVSSAAFQWAGGQGTQYSTERYLAHAGAGCVSAVAGGGKCGQGAVAGVFGKFASNELGVSGDGVGAKISNGIIAAVAGGIGSVLGGGKFENGARTAAYGYLFNELSGRSSKIQRGYADKQTMYNYNNGWIDAEGNLKPYDPVQAGKDFALVTDVGGTVAALGTAACVAFTPCAGGAVVGGTIVGAGLSIANSVAQSSPSSTPIDYAIDRVASLVPGALKFFSQIAAEFFKKTDSVDNVKKKADTYVKE